MKFTVLIPFLILSMLPAHAQHDFRVLHDFGNGHDGRGVYGSVVLDNHGNVYGVTFLGGSQGKGTVFELTPQSNGKWQESILHDFPSSSKDGAGPWGGMAIDASGNLYGTTTVFGTDDFGVAFELTPGQHGWAEKIMDNFSQRQEICCPTTSVIADPEGNVYGAGSSVFELSPGQRKWTETTLHYFFGQNGDGLDPGTPVRDAAGNVYGTTNEGGGGQCSGGCGTVWELTPPAEEDPPGTGRWKEHILHRFGFSKNDGVWPSVNQLAMDSRGNLYGVAQGGSSGSAGIIFKFAPPANGPDSKWKETILYSLTGGRGRRHSYRSHHGQSREPVRHNGPGRFPDVRLRGHL